MHTITLEKTHNKVQVLVQHVPDMQSYLQIVLPFPCYCCGPNNNLMEYVSCLVYAVCIPLIDSVQPATIYMKSPFLSYPRNYKQKDGNACELELGPRF